MTERILSALTQEDRVVSYQMPEEVVLREKARAAIKAGRMPTKLHQRLWGGSGTGGPCSVCDLPVSKDQPESEIEFTTNGVASSLVKFVLHVRCFAAWEFERTKIRE